MHIRIGPLRLLLGVAIAAFAVHRCSLPELVYAGQDYLSVAEVVGQKYNLPEGLLGIICRKESDGRNVRGADGEIGVCQLKPSSVRHAFGEGSYVSPRIPMLAQGSISKHVITLREVLASNGIENLDPSPVRKDYFTQRLGMMVRAYQVAKHLRVDGIVGPQTWGSLLNHESIETQLWDPATNVEYAAKYIQWLSRALKTEDPMILAAAYNGGPGNPVVRYMVDVQSRMIARRDK